MERGFDPFEEPYVDPAERERAADVLGRVIVLPGVSGSLIFRKHDGTIVSQRMPPESEHTLSFAVWSLGIFCHNQDQIPKFGYPTYQQLFLRSQKGYLVLVDMKDEVLEMVTLRLH